MTSLSLTDWFLQYLAAVNVICFVIFAYDKFLAKAHWRRVPEATLLFLSAIGGAAGGLAAMQLVRHKTRKPKFRFWMPFLLVLHIILLALGWYFLRAGR